MQIAILFHFYEIFFLDIAEIVLGKEKLLAEAEYSVASRSRWKPLSSSTFFLPAPK